MSKPKGCKRRGQRNSSCACCKQAATVKTVLEQIDEIMFPLGDVDHECGAGEIAAVCGVLALARTRGVL